MPEIADWCHPNAEEDIPHNAPEPLMKEIALTVFVDANDASDVELSPIAQSLEY